MATVRRASRGQGRSRPSGGAGGPASGWATVLALLAASGCGDTPPPAGAPPAERVPEQEIFDYRLVQTENGVRQWTLVADRMRRFPGQEDAELDNPRMEFYREGTAHSNLTARQGRANLTTKDLQAWGDVLVTTTDGKRLETSELRYEHRTGLVTNDVFNRFTRAGDTVTGYGLVANPSLDYFEIRRRVDAAVSDESAAGGETP